MKIAAQSSWEAEIYAYVLAVKNLRFLQQVLEFLGITLDLPMPIFTDSTTAESWIKIPGATARSRHYEKFLMYAREQYLNKISHPKWIDGQSQIADIKPRRSTRPTSSVLRCSTWTHWSSPLTISGCSSLPTSVYFHELAAQLSP